MSSMNNETCSRCKIKPVDIICNNCQTLKLFCQHCDNFVHNLPSKKNHQRSMNIETSVTNNNINTSIYNDKTKNQILDLNKNKLELENKSPVRNIDGRESHMIKSTENSFLNQYQSYSQLKGIESPKKYLNSVYSNEYMNELKNIYEKEKQELVFKNQALQSHCDRLKSSFTEQITSLQNELNENNRKYSYNLEYIEKENELKIIKIVREKDDEIKDLLYKLKDLEKINEELLLRNNQANIKSNLLKENLEQNIEELNTIVNEKNRELIEMKAIYDEKIDQLTINYNSSKEEIINNYEIRISDLNLNCSKLEENIANIIDEKQFTINRILEKNNNNENHLTDTINNLKEQINELKQKLILKNYLEEENDSLKHTLEKYKNDNKILYTELKNYENKHKILNQQIEDLKRENRRMENILYPSLRITY